MIEFHYALQVCDTSSYQSQKRYCGDDRTLLSKKSISSLIDSIEYIKDYNKDTKHNLLILIDNISKELKEWIDFTINKRNKKINIQLKSVDQSGISSSIKECYQWLETNGKDFVFQIQDDYIFRKNAIYDITAIWYKIFQETETHAVVSLFNDPHSWSVIYHNRPTPRTIFVGQSRYYIQIYDTSCSFFTSKIQFSKHWDLYQDFFKLIDNPINGDLESKSLNYMFTKRGVLGICPMESLSLHMQAETEKDPYIDWQSWWDSINID
jgi:hypothetical protein